MVQCLPLTKKVWRVGNSGKHNNPIQVVTTETFARTTSLSRLAKVPSSDEPAPAQFLRAADIRPSPPFPHAARI